TSVYVTHDQIEAMTMADRIVAMNAGIIQQVGTPLELYDDPANMFVAGFIGSPAMNFLDARARRGEHGIAITVGGTAFCTLPQSLSLPEDGHVKIGIRPERIRIGASGGEGVDAAVDMVETTGAASVAHLDLAGQPLKVFTTERLQFAQGQRVPLAFDTGHVCLFDGASGDRLR
ncbi:MAG: TOBE domain-containing protein, partial [Mesorhizobium sp.]|nr:TOBE domain-containing protein [Mesorhizobium sp.]